jgi:hypothetical protein
LILFGDPAMVSVLLAIEVWKVLASTNDCSVPIVPAFVGRVMARLTDDNAVVERVEASELGMPDVVGVGNLAKTMLRASGFTKLGDP